MIKVREALHSAGEQDSVWAETFKKAAGSVANDAANVASAAAKAAKESNYSVAETSAAIGKAVAETKTGALAMQAASNAAGNGIAAHAAFTYGMIRQAAAQTYAKIASSPLAIGAITGVGAAVAGFVYVTSAVSQANAQLDKFIALGEQADKAGVNVDFWQRFEEGAKKAKLATEDLQALLKNATGAVQPKFEQESLVKKRLTDVFESGYLGDYQSKAMADFRAAPDNEGRIRAAVEAMRELRDLREDLLVGDIGDMLFGEGTAQRIRAGKFDIDAIAKALDRKRDDLITQEQVERAAAFRERLAEAYKQIDETLHVSIAMQESGRDILEVWANIVETIVKASKVLADFGITLDQIGKQREATLAGVAQALGAGAINDWLYGKRQIYDKPAGPDLPEGWTPPQAQPRIINNPPAFPKRPLDLYLHPEKYGLGDAASKPAGGKARDPGLETLDTFIGKLEKAAAAAKAETEAFHRSNAEKEAAIQLAKLKETADQNGITVTEEQTKRVRQAAEATSRYKDTLRDLEQAQHAFGDTVRHFGEGVVDVLDAMLDRSQSLSDVLRSLARSELRNLLSALVTGTGPLASLVGTAPKASDRAGSVGGLAGMLIGGAKSALGGFDFGGIFGGSGGGSGFDVGDWNLNGGLDIVDGFRANGGPVRAGGVYAINELGQELFMPGSDGRIVPAGGAGAGPGQAGPLTMTVNLDGARGNREIEEVVYAAVGQGLSAYDQRLDRTLGMRVARSNMRYGRR